MKDRKPKAPHLPKCLCGGTIKWIFGIASPALMMCENSTKAKEYRLKYNKYLEELYLWKVRNRKANKVEWKEHESRRRRELNNINSAEYYGEAIGIILVNGFMSGLNDNANS